MGISTEMAGLIRFALTARPKLSGHLHRNGVVDAFCPNCGTEETVGHFLLFCKRIQVERSYTVEAILEHNIHLTLQDLLTVTLILHLNSL